MSVTIALAQIRSKAGDIDANLKKLSDYAGFASKGGAKLIITPELFLTGYNVKPLTRLRELAVCIPSNYNYNDRKHSILDRIASICTECDTHLLIGLPEIRTIDDRNVYYNTALWMDNKGKIISIYRKYHLWGKLERSIFDEYPNDNGQQYKVIKSPLGLGINFGVLICYDIEFGINCIEHILIKSLLGHIVI